MDKPFLLGSDGRFGASLVDRFDLPGADFSEPETGYRLTSEALRQNPKLPLVVSVAAQFQVQVHERVFEMAQDQGAQPTIININSVQDQVPKELEYRLTDIPEGITLVGLHPHHGHTLTGKADVPKNWLLTYAKSWDRNQQRETKTVKRVRARLNAFFDKNDVTDIKVVDLDAAAKELAHFRNGADLHDTLTAYSQALVHMIRLLVNDDNIFFEQFVELQVSPSLSQAIVNQNPYAREGVYRRLKTRLPHPDDPSFIPTLRSLALELSQEYRSRFKDIPSEILDAAETPKFNELIAKISQ